MTACPTLESKRPLLRINARLFLVVAKKRSLQSDIVVTPLWPVGRYWLPLMRCMRVAGSRDSPGLLTDCRPLKRRLAVYKHPHRITRCQIKGVYEEDTLLLIIRMIWHELLTVFFSLPLPGCGRDPGCGVRWRSIQVWEDSWRGGGVGGASDPPPGP